MKLQRFIGMRTSRNTKPYKPTPVRQAADVLEVCPYCGDTYGGRLGCCGESIAHAVFVISDDETGAQYDTSEAAWAAIERRDV